jgi:hypothetical protein
MACHSLILPDSPKLKLLHTQHEKGLPIKWVRVHLSPDYAFFDHSIHVAAGVGCTSCHGRIDRMDIVSQVEPLSMSWCLDCHRAPNSHLRPPQEVTNMTWIGSAEQREYLNTITLCLRDLATCPSPELKRFMQRRKDIQRQREDIAFGRTTVRHSFLGHNIPQSDPAQIIVFPPEHCSGCHR